jgi:hypothetical protein
LGVPLSGFDVRLRRELSRTLSRTGSGGKGGLSLKFKVRSLRFKVPGLEFCYTEEREIARRAPSLIWLIARS